MTEEPINLEYPTNLDNGTTPPPTQNVVKNILIEEITKIRDKSMELNKIIKESKTNTKRKYFQKKLKKNNELFMRYLVGLENLNNKDKTIDENS